MAWNVGKWVKKYREALYHPRLNHVLAEKLPETIKKGLAAIPKNQMLDEKVKVVLDRYGVVPDIRIGYYAYARLLDKSQRKLAYMVDRIREHQILRATFEASGLNPEILDRLDQILIYNKANP